MFYTMLATVVNLGKACSHPDGTNEFGRNLLVLGLDVYAFAIFR